MNKELLHNAPGKCPRCGRLYRAEPGRTLCHTCSGDLAPETHDTSFEEHSVVPLAEQRYTSLMDSYNYQAERAHSGRHENEEVQRNLGMVSVESIYDPDRNCTVCDKPSLKNSDFCLGCQSRLHNDFGEAASSLFTEMESVEESDTGSVRSVMSALASARRRSPHTRINPVAMGKLKT